MQAELSGMKKTSSGLEEAYELSFKSTIIYPSYRAGISTLAVVSARLL